MTDEEDGWCDIKRSMERMMMTDEDAGVIALVGWLDDG